MKQLPSQVLPQAPSKAPDLVPVAKSSDILGNKNTSAILVSVAHKAPTSTAKSVANSSESKSENGFENLPAGELGIQPQQEANRVLSQYELQTQMTEEEKRGGRTIGDVDDEKYVILRQYKIKNPENSKDESQLLNDACLRGDIDAVIFSLNNGADVNYKDKENGNTPLISTAFCNDKGAAFEIAELLFGRGANNVNEKNEEGASALVVACENGNLELAKILFEKGAKINQAGKEGASPLFMATQNGHADVVKFLLGDGADVNQAHESGATALFVACQNGHLDVIKELIGKGADINQGLKNGASPLYIACQNGHLDVVKELMKNGADIGSENDKFNPLAIAQQKGHSQIAEFLSERGSVDKGAGSATNQGDRPSPSVSKANALNLGAGRGGSGQGR